ncbi:hypothetical protein MKW92_020420 [Papaver armeniacum]|nr:hypothetical protein MKW92_020420 [Papaver armeniacum]
MGRPPCCDKVGIKKGPWTPEEDIILSCRLRWTNYLRPGIKESMRTNYVCFWDFLVHRWAAIASYLPQRTDNDIKNYWNTHLKKKMNKFQSALNPPPPPLHQVIASNSTIFAHQHHDLCYTDKSDDQSTTNPSLLLDHHIMINHGTTTTSGGGATYASSTENISRLLEGWMRSSPKLNSNKKYICQIPVLLLKAIKRKKAGNKLHHPEQESSSNDTDLDEKMRSFPEINTIQNLMENGQQQPFRLFEKWLLDEAAIHQGVVELSSINDDHSFSHDM